MQTGRRGIRNLEFIIVREKDLSETGQPKLIKEDGSDETIV